jgi:glycosyltransferase involved in cell wall biosynthesis
MLCDTPVPTAPALSGVLEGRDILCFSHDWTGDPLSRTHLMRLLARANRVLWVNSIGYRSPTLSKADLGRALKKVAAAASPVREVEPNIFVFNPLAIPAYGRPRIRAMNQWLLRLQVKRAMRRLGFGRPVSWVSNPAAAVIAGAFDEDLLIYHCVDENSAFSGVSAQSIAELESQLLRKADLVIVTSERLYHSKAKITPRTLLVRHGVDFDHFRRALDPRTKVPDDLARLPRPVIGFFGLIADWVDVDLMAHVARQFPQASLVVIGKATADTAALKRVPNVHLLGRKPYEQLPAYCKGFDVALMPFRINELTLNSNPLKVREYLAAGLPVVSTPIPEVQVLGQCRIAAGPDAFVREVRAALEDPGPRRERSEAIRCESWEARLEDIRRGLARVERFGEPGGGQ